jgi:hypothetical protein
MSQNFIQRHRTSFNVIELHSTSLWNAVYCEFVIRELFQAEATNICGKRYVLYEF